MNNYRDTTFQLFSLIIDLCQYCMDPVFKDRHTCIARGSILHVYVCIHEIVLNKTEFMKFSDENVCMGMCVGGP